VVQEVEAANRYVSAHAYPDVAISRALRCGCAPSNTANLLTREPVVARRALRAFTPTLTTYWALKMRTPLGLPAVSHAMDAVLDAGRRAGLGPRAGVTLCYGTDLLACSHQPTFPDPSRGTAVIEVIRSATTYPAELLAG
jgi:hypothetical protein